MPLPRGPRQGLSVGPDAVVAERRDLVRVAELVSTGAVDRDVAERVETALLDEREASAPTSHLTATTGPAAASVDVYLARRSQEPSDAAPARYSVYLQNETPTSQRPVFVDRRPLAEESFDALSGQYDRVDDQRASSDEARELTADDCRRPVPEQR